MFRKLRTVVCVCLNVYERERERKKRTEVISTFNKDILSPFLDLVPNNGTEDGSLNNSFLVISCPPHTLMKFSDGPNRRHAANTRKAR